MEYNYIAAWSVIGGISLPEDTPSIELSRSSNCCFTLTNNPDEFLTEIDRRSAIGQFMLIGSPRSQSTTEYNDAINAECEKIRTRRAARIRSYPVLVIKAKGEIDVEVNAQIREHEEFVVAYKAVNDKEITQRYQTAISAMKMAIAVENESPSRFSPIANGIYLVNNAGKIVHSMSISGGAEGSVLLGFSPEQAKSVSERYATLQKTSEMRTVQRLFSQMAIHDADRLKSFLFCWQAFEILIKQSFRKYKGIFFSSFTDGNQPQLRGVFLQRINEVMGSRYKATHKFIAVSIVFFPDASEKEAQEDYDMFVHLRELRNNIVHGKRFVENDLPIHELANLFRKYLIARISMQ